MNAKSDWREKVARKDRKENAKDFLRLPTMDFTYALHQPDVKYVSIFPIYEITGSVKRSCNPVEYLWGHLLLAIYEPVEFSSLYCLSISMVFKTEITISF